MALTVLRVCSRYYFYFSNRKIMLTLNITINIQTEHTSFKIQQIAYAQFNFSLEYIPHCYIIVIILGHSQTKHKMKQI